MRRYGGQSPLTVALKGTLAGLVGTGVLTVVAQRGPSLIQEMGVLPRSSGERHPQEAAGETTGRLAEKVAAGVLETDIQPDTKETAAQAIHWGYGALWGTAYGTLQSSLR